MTISKEFIGSIFPPQKVAACLQPKKLKVSQTITVRSHSLRLNIFTFNWSKVPPGETSAPMAAPSLPSG